MEPKSAIIDGLTKCSMLLTSERRNPYLHMDAPHVADLRRAVDDAVALTQTGGAADAVKTLETDVQAWLDKFGPLPKPASPPEYGVPLETFLAGDKLWQETIAPLKDKKKLTFGVPVTVDPAGVARPIDLAKAMTRAPGLEKAVADVIPRIPFKAGQPGKLTVLFTVGSAK